MFRIPRIIVTTTLGGALALGAMACASLKLWGGNPAPGEIPPDDSGRLGESDIRGLNAKEMELRVAKLWARVDELESEVMRQKERQHILEKGVRLGIVPEELRAAEDEDANDPVLRHRNGMGAGGAAGKAGHATKKPARDIPPAAAKTSESQAPQGEGLANHDGEGDPQAYQSDLAKAQSYFNAGKYGEAILAFEKIGKDYPTSLTQGNHSYWIGLCWFYLKDYFAAKRHLEGFVTAHGQNPWAPRARLYLALVDKENGLLREAQAKLKAVLQEFPQNEVADAAKLEIKKLEEQL